MKTLGTILMIIGITAIFFSGFTLITKKHLLNIGKVEVNRQEQTPIYWSPISGIVILGAGAVIYLLAKNRTKGL